jgi:hypothetical protein
MKAMFLKQCVSAAGFAALVLAIACALRAGTSDFTITTNLYSDSATSLIALLWGLGALGLGFGGFTLEESRKTRGYWLHRGMSARRVFVAKVLADVGMLAVALLAYIAFDAALTALRHDSSATPPPEWSRYFQLLVASASAFLGHALGMLGAHLRRPNVVRVLSTWFAACGATYLTFLWMLHVGERWLPNAAAWIAWMAGWSLILYPLAFRAFASGTDEDRPLPRPVRGAFNASALAIGAGCCLAMATVAEDHAVAAALRKQPRVLRAEGNVRLEADFSRSHPARGVQLFDPVERLDRHDPLAPAWDFHLTQPAIKPFVLGDQWVPLPRTILLRSAAAASGGDTTGVSARLEVRSGRVRVYGYPWLRASFVTSGRTTGPKAYPIALELEAPFRVSVERPDGKRFSDRVLMLSSEHHHDSALYDDGDHTLWRLAFAPLPRLERELLPEGDEPIGVDAAIDAELVAVDSPYWRYGDSTTAIRGRAARYVWGERGFERFELPAGRVWRSERGAPTKIALEVRDSDVLEPHVVVRDVASGAVLLEHRYAAPRLLAGIAYLGAACRSPIANVVSWLGPDPRRPGSIDLLRDPLVAGGRRSWLLALNVGVSLALAAWFARRSALGLRWSWFALFALFGPPLALLAGVLESRVPTPPRPAARTPLRIAAAPRARRLEQLEV